MCSIPSSERFRAGFLFSRYGLCLARVRRILRKSKRRERPAPECAGLIARCGLKSRKTGAKTGEKRTDFAKKLQNRSAHRGHRVRDLHSLSGRVTLSGQVNNGIALRAIKRPVALFSPLSRPVLACRPARARRRHGTAKCVLAYWRSHLASVSAGRANSPAWNNVLPALFARPSSPRTPPQPRRVPRIDLAPEERWQSG